LRQRRDSGLTQKQLTLLRKLVETSASIVAKDGSIEFLVDHTTAGTSAMFIGAAGAPEIENLSTSDLNELLRRGWVARAGAISGDETFQVVNEAFELFREEHVVESTPSRFNSGETGLDELLDAAITKHSLHDLHERKDALEKLWDAWERLKTLEPGDKKASSAALLDKAASEETFREILETEARTLTGVGNDFRIRHHETGKIELSDPHQVDYLFERMLALVRLLLKKSGRI